MGLRSDRQTPLGRDRQLAPVDGSILQRSAPVRRAMGLQQAKRTKRCVPAVANHQMVMQSDADRFKRLA